MKRWERFGFAWIAVKGRGLPQSKMLARGCAPGTQAVWRTGKTSDWMTLGICGQAVVFWIAMFCFCYGGFTGPVLLTRGVPFSVANSVGLGGGVFSVTVLLILIPMVAVLLSKARAWKWSGG